MQGMTQWMWKYKKATMFFFLLLFFSYFLFNFRLRDTTFIHAFWFGVQCSNRAY